MGFLSSGIPNVTPKEAYALCRNGATMIDLRSEYLTAYKQFGVEKILYSPKNRSNFRSDLLDKKDIYIITETSTCDYSNPLVKDLLAQGFQSVFNLAGGFVEWERDGLPIVEDKEEKLSGSCMCQLRPREKKK